MKGNLVKKLAIGTFICASAFYAGWTYTHTKQPVAPIKHDNNIVAPMGYDFTNANEANEQLIRFPTSIPGASRVDKYLTPDAQKILVHVRQIHLGKNDTDEDLQITKEVQTNMYKILDYLRKDTEILVNTENVNSDDIGHEDWEHREAIVNGTGHDFITDKIIRLENHLKENTNLEDKISIENLLNEFRKFDSIQKYGALKTGVPIYNAVKQLAKEGKLIRLRGETTGKRPTHNEALRLGRIKTEKGDSIDSDIYITLMCENREDTLLNLIVRDRNMISYTNFGGGHAWGGLYSCGKEYMKSIDRLDRLSVKDNIFDWNKKNPDEKISLIEITPLSYDKNKIRI